MKLGLIPIRLTLEELCLSALMEAADAIDMAQDRAAFTDAMDHNYRIWLVMNEVGARDCWGIPPSGDVDFVLNRSATQGIGVNDGEIEAIITINRRVAKQLAAGGDVERIRTRIRLAYREGDGRGFIPWILEKMYEKSRLKSFFDPNGGQEAFHPVSYAAALECTSGGHGMKHR